MICPSTFSSFAYNSPIHSAFAIDHEATTTEQSGSSAEPVPTTIECTDIWRGAAPAECTKRMG